MSKLIETLAAELERPRPVSAQVAAHIIGTYNIDRESVGAFLLAELHKLEDYEIDLILSPLFTPTLQEQSVIAGLLGSEIVPPTRWPELIQLLVARPTQGRFITEDGKTHAAPLRDVTIERYVHRLRLDGTMPESLRELIDRVEPESDHSMLKAVARRAIWEKGSRQDILVCYFTASAPGVNCRLDDVVELLKLVETYEPTDVTDLLSRVPHWQQVIQQEIGEASSPKPFFNERVQELHGGGRDQRRHENVRITAKENERAFLERLQKTLSS